MLTFWEWIKVTSEAVAQQRNRITDALHKLYPSFKPNQINKFIAILAEMESQLTNTEDIRKSATISRFLKTFRPEPSSSEAHALDYFKRELQTVISNANAKSSNPEDQINNIRTELQKALPGESQETIDELLKQVQSGARIRDVVNAYLAKKNAIGKEDRVVAKRGSLEMIEIYIWREGGKEQHIDKEKGLQACHPLLKGTKWCTRFKEYFDDYTANGPLYLIRDNGKPLVLGHKNSDWLDVNDNDPDPEMMQRVAPLIMDSGIASDSSLGDVAEGVVIKAVIYLPNPVNTLETYAGKYNPTTLAKMRAELLGVPYEPVQTKNDLILEIEKYDWLSGFVEQNAGYAYNKINFDIDDIHEMISTNAGDNKVSTADLIYNLDSKTEDRLANINNARYEQGQYGKIDGWDDMDLEESIEYDDELLTILSSASYETVEEKTLSNIYSSAESTLAAGDDNGFKVIDWTLIIPAGDVNNHIKEQLDKGYKPDHLIEKMNFKLEVEDVSLAFSGKLYNEKVNESLDSLKF